MLGMINYSGDKRDEGTRQVQDFITVHGITINVKLEKKPRIVTLVPEGREVSFTYSERWQHIYALPFKVSF